MLRPKNCFKQITTMHWFVAPWFYGLVITISRMAVACFDGFNTFPNETLNNDFETFEQFNDRYSVNREYNESASLNSLTTPASSQYISANDLVDQLFNIGTSFVNEYYDEVNNENLHSEELNHLLTDDLIENVFKISSNLLSELTMSDAFNIILKSANRINPNITKKIADHVFEQVELMFDSAAASMDNVACASDVKLYLRSLRSGHNWALRMLDSSAKLPSGLLMAYLYDLGNYDECVEIEGVESEFGNFRGQYCLVDIKPSLDLMRGMMAMGNITEEQDTLGNNTSNLAVSFKWAVCVPSSCRPRDLEQFLRHNLPKPLSDVRLSVADASCSTAATPAFRPIDWLAVGVLSFFGMLVVLSTSYDLLSLHSQGYFKPESRSVLLLAFSLYTNGNKLLHAPTSANTLPAVHGVRCLSMMWVIYGHCYYYARTFPAVNSIVLLDYATDWAHVILINTPLAVDSFLLLSGFLLCYLWFAALEDGLPFNVPAVFIYRYIRLTPPLAIMILFQVTLFNYIDNGPLWKTEAGVAISRCENNWWTNLLYINNYVNPLEACLGQTWYISVDTQLLWISPLLIYPLWRWPKFGKCLLGASFLCGIIVVFTFTYINETFLIFRPMAYDLSLFVDYFQKSYLPTHMRFTPWLLGIALGYLLHRTKHSPAHLSKWSVLVGWVLSAVCLIGPVLSLHYAQQPEYRPTRILESLRASLGKPAWALGLAWVIYACVKGYGGFVNTFLSWRFLQVLSRLTYCMYLTHTTILSWTNASMKVPVHIEGKVFMIQFFGVFVLTSLISLVLSLVFESPSIVLGKYFLDKYYHELMSRKVQTSPKIAKIEANTIAATDCSPESGHSDVTAELISSDEVDKEGCYPATLIENDVTDSGVEEDQQSKTIL